MPTLTVDAEALYERLKGHVSGLPLTFELFGFVNVLEKLAFDYGLEYDGLDETSVGGAGMVAMGGAIRPRVRVDIPANRYDLLCLEGLAEAFVRYVEPTVLPFPEYKYVSSTGVVSDSIQSSTNGSQITVRVRASAYPLRPYCVAAVFRGVSFDGVTFASFIDLQDKLHQNLARRRTLVSMGTHDLDQLAGCEFEYGCLPRRGGFHFRPLNQTVEVDGEGMMSLLAESYLKPYLGIIADADAFPVVQDGQGRVASVPPIINSDFSRMGVNTTNVFVEITATDHHKAEIVLDQIVAFMADKMPTPYTVEPVTIIYDPDHPGLDARVLNGLLPKGDETAVGKTAVGKTAVGKTDVGKTDVGKIDVGKIDVGKTDVGKTDVGKTDRWVTHEIVTPRLNTSRFKLSLDYCRKVIGLSTLDMQTVLDVLPKMGLRVLPESNKSDTQYITVECPITRRDILHPCDIVEDIAIAIGYNNIGYHAMQAVKFQTMQNLTETTRRLVAEAGWKECLTFGLVSHKDCYAALRRTDGLTDTNKIYYSHNSAPVIVQEPKTREFEIVRPTLIPGLLNTLSSNQAQNLPIKLFEMGEVLSSTTTPFTEPNSATIVRDNHTIQKRYFSALMADANKSCLENVHGLLDYVLMRLGFKAEYSQITNARAHHNYYLRPIDREGPFLKKRQVDIMAYNKEDKSDQVCIGVMGVIHPETLGYYGIPFPCSLFEITLEPIVHWLDEISLSAP
ncbi:phenylalanyl-tRNA synthetase beta subunit [Gregarina niphandrodes]|uniref:phenylalanine--tRNA ligase n=1 Tax=Gregarina niphandrodes TaxID=110365 RepID=A0A023B310_GRENI|nr:phenylalanyl-tRNA synthetase beta subunit [Gregarina niphandrodes]EZG54501.1 phenylalanyl-tRNA synthetase beta subunit [Gregarina niphandrodes]|eukprot:XP_011131838.1 phenylalanyl-tRNA synthetase beta subunit [Gregarina niphandrodes]